MRKYELVTVIDTNLSTKEIQDVSASVQKLLGKGILETDEIGLMPTAYPIAGQDQAYYVSYYIEIDPDTIPGIKSDLSIVKGLVKFSLFSLREDEKFLKMADLEKRFLEVFPVEEEVEEPVSEESAE